VEFDMTKGRVRRSLLRWILFAVLGMAAFSNPLDRWNLANLVFGSVTGLFFGYLFRRFLVGFLGLFNRHLKKEKGKEAIIYAVDCAMMFLTPFAAMILLAVFYLKWSMTAVFISAGVMAVGTAAALEIGKLKGTQEIKNTIAAAIISYLFSFAWTLSVQWLAKIPLYVNEGGINLLKSALTRGGSAL